MCDHGHNHTGCSHESSDTPTASDHFRYDLRSYIDFDRVTVLNEAVDDAGKEVFKTMETRNDRTIFVDSDCDEELLFNIPFTGHVKLSGLAISGDENETHPAKIRIFKDREAMSFDDCRIAADQEIDLKMDANGVVDYPLKASKFANIHHLAIHVAKNFGADATRVYYIGLRGEFQHEFRSKIAIATYESRAQLKDHKSEIPDAVGHSLF
ncbi:unnamed protein product [Caenorhabditis bovis]|uniref:PITH domain-containing protein n=1 Tax=Caenorhabditis bovis TaxID=2654633 RepID=A0A8S1ELI4_9PELO|nr:unnamed protein product [Caenorhabditis bovis]